MSLQSDIYSALSSVAGGRVYPQIVKEESALPLVIWRILSQTPLEALGGYQGMTRYAVVFEAWAATYDGAVSVAAQIETAIEASAMTSYRESASGADFEPALDEFMEPVYFGFWHAT